MCNRASRHNGQLELTLHWGTLGANVERARASHLRGREMGLCLFLEGCFRGVSSLALLSCSCMFEHMPTASNKASGSVACVVGVCPLARRAGCPRKGWGTDSVHRRETVTGKIATAAVRGLIGARQRAAYTPHPVPFHVPLGVRLLRAQLMAKETEAQRQCTCGGTTRDSQTSS